MGVWIETLLGIRICLLASVTPHVGVWIETPGAVKQDIKDASLPMWECGLKLLVL